MPMDHGDGSACTRRRRQRSPPREPSTLLAAKLLASGPRLPFVLPESMPCGLSPSRFQRIVPPQLARFGLLSRTSSSLLSPRSLAVTSLSCSIGLFRLAQTVQPHSLPHGANSPSPPPPPASTSDPNTSSARRSPVQQSQSLGKTYWSSVGAVLSRLRLTASPSDPCTPLVPLVSCRKPRVHPSARRTS